MTNVVEMFLEPRCAGCDRSDTAGKTMRLKIGETEFGAVFICTGCHLDQLREFMSHQDDYIQQLENQNEVTE